MDLLTVMFEFLSGDHDDDYGDDDDGDHDSEGGDNYGDGGGQLWW